MILFKFIFTINIRHPCAGPVTLVPGYSTVLYRNYFSGIIRYDRHGNVENLQSCFWNRSKSLKMYNI